MALNLLYEDDFVSYGTDENLLAAAYPYDPPGDLSPTLTPHTYLTVGPTEGPSGVPGVQNTTYNTGPIGQFTYFMAKVGLEPQCREFQAVGTWDFTSFSPAHPLNAYSGLIQVWSYEYGNRLDSFDGNLVQISRGNSTGQLVITIQTTAAYGNSVTPLGLYGQNIEGVLLENNIYTIRVYGRSSILTETSPGVWAPSTDGFAKVFINDVEVFSFDGPVWHGEPTTNRNWNSVTWGLLGRFALAQVWDEVGCSPVPPNPPNCECTPPIGPPKPPGSKPPVIIDPPPIDTTIGEQLACLGGGVVPTQADFIPVEFWWAA